MQVSRSACNLALSQSNLPWCDFLFSLRSLLGTSLELRCSVSFVIGLASAVKASRSPKKLGAERSHEPSMSKMRVGDGVGVVATAPKLARVNHRPRASGVARVDGIRLMLKRTWKSPITSSKSTLISEPVQSLRRNGPNPGRNNRCQADDWSGVIKPQTRGSCRKATDLLA